MKLFALFSFRYDADLVPDLLSNLSFVDGYICHDDRGRKAIWYDEGKIRNELVQKARNAGADWVLCMDPDERVEKKAGNQIRRLIETTDDIIYGFKFRELYEPLAFRIDGIWGNKERYCLFPIREGQVFDSKKLHSPWYPSNPEYRFEMTNLNIYHFKHIDPVNRVARRDLYNKIDAQKEFQPIGYDYLTDESSLLLKKIRKNREYFPKYNEEINIRQTGS